MRGRDKQILPTQPHKSTNVSVAPILNRPVTDGPSIVQSNIDALRGRDHESMMVEVTSKFSRNERLTCDCCPGPSRLLRYCFAKGLNRKPDKYRLRV